MTERQIKSILMDVKIPLWTEEYKILVNATHYNIKCLKWNLFDLFQLDLNLIYLLVVEIQKTLSYNNIESQLKWLENGCYIVSLEFNMMEKHLNFVIPYDRHNEYLKFVFEVNQAVELEGVCSLNVNNNPYHLQSTLNVTTKNENEIRALAIKYGVQELGNGKTEEDYFFEALKYRKWNRTSLYQGISLEGIQELFSNLFIFNTAKELEEKGYYNPDPIKKVFLSYSHKDKPLVEKIKQELIDCGISVWFDDAEIDFGDHILKKVTEGLNSSPISLVFVSENTKSSLFAKQELSSIYLKAINQLQTRMILVKIDDVKIDEIFFGLSTFKYADIRQEKDKTKLFTLIREELKRIT